MDRGQAGEESLEPRQSNGMEDRNAVATRKVIKSDRAKLKRGKLNGQLLELSTLLDTERPKNYKGSIITDTIQVLKELDSEVKKLKAEHAVLCEESRELTQEKTELREEKASLKTNIQNLRVQHQPAQGFMVPWPTLDSPILMAPSYPFPVAVPMHQTTQPCSTFIPYLAPVIPQVDQSATLNASTSYISGPKASSSRSFGSGSSNEVATDLELKTPGSASTKEVPTREKRKQPEKHQEKSAINGSSLSKSSSQAFRGSSSAGIDDNI